MEIPKANLGFPGVAIGREHFIDFLRNQQVYFANMVDEDADGFKVGLFEIVLVLKSLQKNGLIFQFFNSLLPLHQQSLNFEIE